MLCHEQSDASIPAFHSGAYPENGPGGVAGADRRGPVNFDQNYPFRHVFSNYSGGCERDEHCRFSSTAGSDNILSASGIGPVVSGKLFSRD